MLLKVYLRIEDVSDNSLTVDNICHAPRQPKSRGYTIALPDYTTLITQQYKGQSILLGEPLMGLRRVRTDPNYLRSGVLENLVIVPKCTRFGGTAECVILRVEVKHNTCLIEIIPKTNCSTRLVWKCKVWGRFANLHHAIRRLRLFVMFAHDVSSS